MRKRDRNLVLDAALGAAAGALATWVMGRVTTFLYAREDPIAKQKEDAVRGGKAAYEIAAEKGAALIGKRLSQPQRKALSTGLHWGLGIGAGAAYGVLRHRMPRARFAGGVGFGTAFWAAIDEGANTVLGITPSPARFPWQSHARGLAGHVVYGVVADTALRLADRVA